MSKRKSLPVLCGWVVILLILARLSHRGGHDEVLRRGYYQSPALDRVMTFQLPRAGMTLAELPRATLHTAGHMTAEYFYEPGALMPIDGVTQARSLWEANRVIFEIPGLARPRFARMIGRGEGDQRIEVDCKASPGNALCGGQG